MVLKEELSVDLRVKICTLHVEGFSYGVIAEKMGVSKSGVKRTVDRFKKTGECANQSGRGRKRCTSAQEDKHITQAHKKNQVSDI